ncbi:hypothetical protein RND71_034001 [Anisodus tanguticus]|uniref:Uncharacterized protein n=1 Tax=Anisodus tanguticus TaxID=243964 RepID=A0AAE1UY01_9SOLA|nr:hypothetical protein RND71_034001 [Anisodus tanguticus]
MLHSYSSSPYLFLDCLYFSYYGPCCHADDTEKAPFVLVVHIGLSGTPDPTTFLTFMLHLPTLDAQVSTNIEFKDSANDFNILGFSNPVPVDFFPSFMLNRIEMVTLGSYIMQQDHIGPSSATFLSFGSMGSLNGSQVIQIAKGLEKSGWNSILESLYYGVPIGTWPIYAEQYLNEIELVKELNLAVEITMDYRDGTTLVSSEEVANGVKKLMDSDGEVRQRFKKMSEKCKEVWKENGSSHVFLGGLIDKLMAET